MLFFKCLFYNISHFGIQRNFEFCFVKEHLVYDTLKNSIESYELPKRITFINSQLH